MQTDGNGYNENVYLTMLCNVILLGLGESPFWSQTGIPAQQSVLQQVYPDYYVAVIQQMFAPLFASLVISRVSGSNPPAYAVNVTTLQGSQLTAQVAI